MEMLIWTMGNFEIETLSSKINHRIEECGLHLCSYRQWMIQSLSYQMCGNFERMVYRNELTKSLWAHLLLIRLHRAIPMHLHVRIFCPNIFVYSVWLELRQLKILARDETNELLTRSKDCYVQSEFIHHFKTIIFWHFLIKIWSYPSEMLLSINIKLKTLIFRRRNWWTLVSMW